MDDGLKISVKTNGGKRFNATLIEWQVNLTSRWLNKASSYSQSHYPKQNKQK